MPLLQAMAEACEETDVGAIQGWIRHSMRFFPRCLAREDIACDVDEVHFPFQSAVFWEHIFVFLFNPMQTYLTCICRTDLFGKKN